MRRHSHKPRPPATRNRPSPTVAKGNSGSVGPQTPSIQAINTVLSGQTQDAPDFQKATTAALALRRIAGIGVDLSPGQAPPSVMRALMRRSQADHEGLDTETAARRIDAKGGRALPEGIRARMESAFGHDFSDVRIHTDEGAGEAAAALHALAFTVGRDIFFSRNSFDAESSKGLTLLAHELTHVVQGNEGRLPSPKSDGMDVSKPSDPHEREAEAMGRQVAQQSLGSAPETTGWNDLGLSEWMSHSTDAFFEQSAGSSDNSTVESSPDLLSRAQAPATSSTSRPSGSTTGTPSSTAAANNEPLRTRLDFGGQPIDVVVRQREGNTWRVNLQNISLPGVQLRQARLETDAQGHIASGSVQADIQLGDRLQALNTTLQIGPGGRVQRAVAGITVPVGSVGTATVSVSFTPNGAQAQGTLNFDAVHLPHGLSLDGGNLAITVDSAGNVSGHGTLMGPIPHLGRFALNASLNGENLSGSLSISLDPGEVAPGLILNAGVLNGSFSPEACEVSGDIDVGISDWAQGNGQFRYDVPSARWEGQAELYQIAEKELGQGFMLSEGWLQATVSGSALTEVSAEGTLSDQTWTGSFEGRFDVPASAFTGSATLSLQQPIDLGSGATLTQADGQLDIADNSPGPLRGSVTAELPYQGQNTFRVEGEDLEIPLDQPSLSGTVTLSTLRPLIAGNEGGVRAEIAAGASAQANVVENAVTELIGAIPFTLSDEVGEIGTGEGNFTLSEAGFAGEATLSLTQDYGFPDRANITAALLTGSTFRIQVSPEGASSASVEQGAFRIQNPEGEGTVEGSFSGTVDLVSHIVDGTGDAHLSSDWPIPATWGQLTLTQGGSVSATIEAGRLSQLDGELRFAADIEGNLPLSLIGIIQGHYQDGKVTGHAQAMLSEALAIPLSNGDILNISEGAQIQTDINDNAVETVTADADVSWEHGEGPLLEGSLSGATYNVQTGMLSFTGTLTLAREITQPSATGAFSLHIKPGSTIEATVTDNALSAASGTLLAGLDDSQGPLLDGQIEGSLDPQSLVPTGDGSVQTVRDVVWPDPLPGDMTATLEEGATANVHVQEGEPTQADGSLSLRLDQGEGELAHGDVNGSWDLQEDKIAGTADLSLSRDVSLPVPEGARLAAWGLVMGEGSSLSATVTDSQLSEASIDAQGRAELAGAKVADLSLQGTWQPGEEGGQVDGSGTVTVTESLPLGSAGGYDMSLEAGTTATGTVLESQMSDVSGTLIVDASTGGTAKVEATATGVLDNSGLSGQGSAEVLDDIQIAATDSYELSIETGSSATATLEQDALTTLEGELSLRLDEGADPLLRGAFQALYATADGSQADVNANGMATLLKDVGAEKGQWRFVVEEGSQIGATIADSSLEGLEGSAGLRVEDAEGALFEGQLTGRYDHAQQQVDGQAQVDLVSERELGSAGDGWSLWLVPETNASATVTANTLSEITGSVGAEIRDAQGSFLSFTGNGTAAFGEAPSLDAQGSVEVVGERQIATAGAFAISLLPGGNAQVTVSQNTVSALTGTLLARIDREGAPFVQVELEGSWEQGGSVEGHGRAQLLVDAWEAASLGDFSLWFTQGGEAEVTVAASELSRIEAAIPIEIRKGGGQFLAGEIDGNYDVPGRLFDGAGVLAVVEEQHLADLGSESLWLMPGSGAEVTISDNSIEQIGGSINLSLRDSSEYLRVVFSGQYDMAGGTGFTGSGGADVIREKMLLETGSYGFALMPGTGAHAVVDQNSLTEVSGSVPFRVYQSGEALLEGQVEGVYTTAEGYLDGHGHVELANDRQYGRVKLLKGSGGDGEVVHSELTRVSGVLHAILMDGQGADFIKVDAGGEFDAVNNEIVELEGSATMLRPWTPVPGIVIRDVTGTGHISHNEVDQVEGQGTIEIAALHATGTLSGGWRSQGGQDAYWGEADLDIAMPMRSGRNRGITGAGIHASLHEDNSFDVAGNVNYRLNDKIAGDIQLEMDEQLDPALSGTIHADGTLVEGRELFKLERDLLPARTVMAGPVPITFGVSGSMGASLNPLTFDTSFGVSDFHPLHADVPAFHAEMALQGGANFYMELVPYIGVGVRVSAIELALMAGIEGQARLDVPLNLGMKGTLDGDGNDQFKGSLAIGAKVAPSLTIGAVPFVEGTILGWGLSRHRFEQFRMSHTFADLFTMEWNKTYTFGDQQQSTDGGAQVATSTGGNRTAVQHDTNGTTAAPSLGGNSQAPAPGGDGPQVAGADMGQSEGGGIPGLAELEGPIEIVTTLADGVEGLQHLIGIIGRGPVALLSIAYELVTNWDGIVLSVNKVKNALSKVYDLLAGALPGWWEELKGIIQRGKQALCDVAGLVYEGGKWVAGKVWDGVSWVGSGVASGAGWAWDHTLGALF